MEIREATEKDIPAILDVLRASLGEISSKKTFDVWKFKHLDNPFGKSLVLIALEDKDIIGVRAFMRWQWQFQSKIYKGLRAVDTATHPMHQGKGVFKKLTLQAIEVAKEEGAHFIFNTPNDQSLPGYLKMGWEEVSKLEIKIAPVNPVRWLSNSKPDDQANISSSIFQLDELCSRINRNKEEGKRYFTPKNADYLKWRYQINPLQNYKIYFDKDVFIAAYVKKHKNVKELRIVELLVLNKERMVHAKKIIKQWAGGSKVHVITMSGSDDLNLLSLNGKYGPVLTVRNLNLSEDIYRRTLNLKNFQYNLGDLELF